MGGIPVEDTALTTLGLDQGQPLLYEEFGLRTFRVHGRVIRQGALWIGVPPLPGLGHTHAVITEIGQGNEGTTAHTAHHHNLGHLAHNVVTFNGCQLAAHCTLEGVHGELEQIHQWLRATGSTTKDLEFGPCFTHLAHVPMRDIPCIQVFDQLTVSTSPAALGISHHDGVVNGLKLFGHIYFDLVFGVH